VLSDSICLDTQPPEGYFTINDNASVTKSTAANLTFHLTDLSVTAGMQLSNAPLSDSAPWEPFRAARSWELLPGDGERTVYARFKDGMGHVSGVMTDSIELLSQNTTPNETLPEARMTINGGSTCTLERDITLQIEVENGTAVQMMLGGVPDLQGSTWTDFAPTVKWRLDGPDGNQTVYARFLSAKGLVFGTSATVLLDTLPPSGSVDINDGSGVCGGVNVTLRINGSDANGLAGMLVGNDERFASSEWQPYRAVMGWTLLPGAGQKTVCLRLKDAAGRTSAVFSDTITLDAGAVVPQGHLVINGGDEYTQSRSVTVSVALDDAGLAKDVRMMLSEDPAFSGCKWEPFAPQVQRTLTPNDGPKTIYLMLELKGIRAPLNASTIFLDQTAPSIVLTGPRMPMLHGPNATIEGWTEPGCRMTLNGRPVVPDPSGAFSIPVDLAAGLNSFIIRAVDQAGNTNQTSLALTRESLPVEKPLATTTENLLPQLLLILVLAVSISAGLLWMARRARRAGGLGLRDAPIGPAVEDPPAEPGGAGAPPEADGGRSAGGATPPGSGLAMGLKINVEDLEGPDAGTGDLPEGGSGSEKS